MCPNNITTANHPQAWIASTCLEEVTDTVQAVRNLMMDGLELNHES